MKNSENAPVCFSVRTTDGQGISLAMQELWVTGQICPAGARLVIRHVFESRDQKMLEAIYAFSLPRDAALCKFRVEGSGFTAHSELKSVKEAKEIYEAGVSDGHLSALAQTYRDGRVNLSLGNLRPGERVVVFMEMVVGVESKDNGFRFRFPFTLLPTYHPEARYVESASEVGEMELPESKFSDLILPPFYRDSKHLHRVGFDLDVRVSGLMEVASPSHTLRIRREGSESTKISLGCDGDIPNRDLVVDVVIPSEPVVLVARDSKGKNQIATLLPSTLMGKVEANAKRVVFLIDRSGSMEGQPLDQAKIAIEACLSALNTQDTFGIVAFSSQAAAMTGGLLQANEDNRSKAGLFLQSIEADGGTELLRAFLVAVAVLDGKGGEVYLVTDGQVSETDTLIAKARTQGVRIHTLGIGSAAQDRFLEQFARETGGISRCVTTQERVDLAALDLFASCSSPVAEGFCIEIKIPGRPVLAVEPEPRQIVFAGVPVLAFAEMKPAAKAKIELSWIGPKAGRHEIALPAGIMEAELAQTLKLLRGARLLADAEVKYPEGAIQPAKTQERARKWIETLSKTYGLASRFMALVAVVERAGDKPGEPPKTRVVPVGLPDHLKTKAYFSPKRMLKAISIPKLTDAECYSLSSPSPISSRQSCMLSEENICMSYSGKDKKASNKGDITSQLFELARQLESDGGLPGQGVDERIAKSLMLLLLLAENEFTLGQGPFRIHVRKLMEFVEAPALKLIWEKSSCKDFTETLLKEISRDVPRKTNHSPVVGRLLKDERFNLVDFNNVTNKPD